MNLKKIRVSDDNTHHTFEGRPLYNSRFHSVLKFHPPGLAPVIDESGAYHIRVDGSPAYDFRYIKSFGYYFDKAAVITENGWTHIDPQGKPIYTSRFAWVGNYQDEVCTVRSKEGYYFHINKIGERLYEENMIYAGDFRDGIAVIRYSDEKCTHIFKDGSLVHGKYFNDLDVYHKGYARARDKTGWFHIDKEGDRIYEKNFSMVEPFYNDYALVEMEKEKVIINERGEIVHKLKPSE